MRRITVTSENELRAGLHDAFVTETAVVVAGGAEPPAGVESLVIDVATRGIDLNTEGCHVDDLVFCGGGTLTLAAGEPWADVIELAVKGGWAGVEALAGLPGTVGSVVTANEVRFGRSIADTVSSVRTWDRATDSQKTFAMVNCEFEPGSSRFSRELLPDGTPRYVVVEASLLLKQADITSPIEDPELVEALGIAPGERVPLARVRDIALGSNN